MPRRRTGARDLKTWMSAMRAALRLAAAAAATGARLGAAASKQSPKKKAPKPRSSTIRTKPRAPAAKLPGKTPEYSKSVSSRSTPGSVLVDRFRNAFGTRAYQLYAPRALAPPGTRPPLIVMLHGCGQDASQFASVNRMAERAEANGGWVLFPEQSPAANRNRCWNWFEPSHQGRGAGEPAILAGMVRKLVRVHGLDSRRVFVAGLSAGAAMAVILGRTYPDLFAAVGSVAGMPYGAARTATTALLAMRGRHQDNGASEAAEGLPVRPVRTIILQGDLDRVVVPRNATHIAGAALAGFGPTVVEQDAGTVGAHAVTRIRHRTADGAIAVEQWTLHGVGHAWSGGAPGRFSDPQGPDASSLLLAFFLGQGQDG